MQTPALKRTVRLALLGVSALSAAAVAQTASSCRALVQVDNNLWFASADGKPLAQVTNDRQFRSAAALSPDGAVIAYSGKAAPDDITLVDANGRPMTDVDLKAADAIVDLKWVTPTLLRAVEHVGPEVGRFHFVQLGAGSSASVLPAQSEGSSCAVAPNAKDVACIFGGAAVELNGRSIYDVPDALDSGSTVQVLDAAVGTGVTSSTSPAFRIDVKGISGGHTVQLRITTADGLWTEQYVPPGSAMPVQFGDTSGSVTRYGVVPTTGANAGVVRLTVVQTTGQYSLERAIAWDPRGARIAVVEANAAGKRTWMLLDSGMGQAAISGTGAVDAKEPLPIDAPVRSISFPADTHLRIEGATQVFDKDIPAQGKVPPGGTYAISPALPRQLTLKLAQGSAAAAVRGWSCP